MEGGGWERGVAKGGVKELVVKREKERLGCDEEEEVETGGGMGVKGEKDEGNERLEKKQEGE